MVLKQYWPCLRRKTLMQVVYNKVNNGSVDLGQGANPFKNPYPAPITVNMPSSLLLDLAAHSLEVFNMGQQPQHVNRRQRYWF